LKALEQLTVEHGTSDLQKQMRASLSAEAPPPDAPPRMLVPNDKPHLREQRHWLYRLIDALPLAAGPGAAGILDAMSHLQCTRERPAACIRR
jgi:hypothetical protein